MVENGGGEFETQHRTKNGDIKNVIVTARAFQSAGKPFLHTIFHDITESKKAQNALMASEARYRQLVEVAQEGIWAIDNNFTTTFVNPRMAQILGYQESEMVGKQLFDFLDTNMVEIIRDIVSGYNSQDMKNQYEYAFPHKDGSRHVDTTVSLSIITDDQKQKTGMLAVISDITQRKQAEKALTESEERFRAISTSAMDAIILCDDQDKVIYWNPAAEKTFGFSANEALGKRLTDLVIPRKAHTKHSEFLAKLSESSASKRQFGLAALRKDRSSFPIDLSAVPVKLKDKNCFLAIVRDITEWKAMEEALRQERDLLDSVATSNDAFSINR